MGRILVAERVRKGPDLEKVIAARVLHAHVASQLVGQGVVGLDTGVVRHAEGKAGEVRLVSLHQVRAAASLGAGDDETHEVGASLVAQRWWSGPR